MADRYRKQSEMRNTAFLLSAMQTVTSSTNYAINQMITAESPEDWIFRFPPESETSLPQKCTSAAAACVPPVMTRWMAIRAPVALGRHGWARCVDTSVVSAFPTPVTGRSRAMQPRVPGALIYRVTRSRYAVSLEHSNLTRIVHAPSPYPLTRKRPFPSADVRTSPTGSPARVDRKVPR